MSARKLGGGRVLGSGKNLSPAPSPLSKQRTSTHLSPSASSVSLNSSASTSTPPTDSHDQDLVSRISLDQSNGSASNGTSAIAAAATARLVCPICNEEMMTLLQLNRHLDDVHKNLEEVRQDEVKDWFQTQMVKAKKFQPLAVLNQKLKGLDVFESNDVAPSPSLAPVVVPSGARSPEPSRLDPDEVVTRKHWQRSGPADSCSEPTCGARLNATNGKVNCRKCGKLFCEEHTMYQIKLSRAALHEPVRGSWCRVCETCYKSREGYNDHCFERDHINTFASIRRKVVDQQILEESRLEKRLTRLTQLLANPPEQNASTGGLLWPLNSMKNQRKELEQSVVVWEDDAKIPRCPFCQQDFQAYTFRRHHCRTCGRVVCGDPQTGCSVEMGFNVDAPQRGSEKENGLLSIDIRMCKSCRHTVFSRKDLARELQQKPQVVKLYDNLVQFERGIRILLPKFQRLLLALQDPDKPPSPTQLTDASKVRKRLMDSFTQYDVAARRIRDLPTPSETQRQLQKAVHQKATAFLHTHMLPLKALPKILKHATPSASHSRSGSSALAGIRYNERSPASAASSSSAISAMEEEEKALRERLIVLEEQKFFVGEMVADANKRRKFDEVSALAQNVQDLSREIDAIQGQLASMDFASAYEQARTNDPGDARRPSLDRPGSSSSAAAVPASASAAIAGRGSAQALRPPAPARGQRMSY